MGRTFGLAAACALLAFPSVAPAGPGPAPKIARCDIGNNYGESYKGPCFFTADRDGSFSVTRLKDASIMGDIEQVTVQVVQPGVAEVRGLTRAGISSRWGQANRSKRDRACWRGADFWVCAY